MSRRFDCPWPDHPEAFIDLPDEWLGEHAERRDRAVEKARELDLGGTLTDFSVSMALLDDWSLPGLNGNPENWKPGEVKLPIITWVNRVTLGDFLECWMIPKNSLSPSPNGLTENAEKMTEAHGNSEAS